MEFIQCSTLEEQKYRSGISMTIIYDEVTQWFTVIGRELKYLRCSLRYEHVPSEHELPVNAVAKREKL